MKVTLVKHFCDLCGTQCYEQDLANLVVPVYSNQKLHTVTLDACRECRVKLGTEVAEQMQISREKIKSYGTEV